MSGLIERTDRLDCLGVPVGKSVEGEWFPAVKIFWIKLVFRHCWYVERVAEADKVVVKRRSITGRPLVVKPIAWDLLCSHGVGLVPRPWYFAGATSHNVSHPDLSFGLPPSLSKGVNVHYTFVVAIPDAGRGSWIIKTDNDSRWIMQMMQIMEIPPHESL